MEEVKLELKRKYLLTGLGGKEERGRFNVHCGDGHDRLVEDRLGREVSE